jgi:drug/metabolite transporter (DMT)-like permease
LVSSSQSISYDSYFGLRQLDSIKETGFPLSYDELSYQGRTQAGGGLVYYLLFLVSMFVPSLLLFKFGSIFLTLLLVFFIFRISKHLFPGKYIALLTSAVASSSLVIIHTFLNNLVPSLFFACLFLYAFFIFLRFENDDFVWIFLFLILCSTFISSLSLLFVFIFFIYAFLLKVESFSLRKKEFEVFLVAGLFILWFHLLMYKKVLFNKGAGLLWQSIPNELIQMYYQDVNLSIAVSVIGLLPLVLGLLGFYVALFEQRHRKLIFLCASAIVFGLLLWLGFIPFQEGLFFFVVVLSILSGVFFSVTSTFFRKTKLRLIKYSLVLFFIIFVFGSFLSAFYYSSTVVSSSPSDDVLGVLYHLKNTSSKNTVLASVKEGHLVSYISKNKVLIDENFFLAPDVQDRFDDVETMFLTKSEIDLKRLLHVYSIDYILQSPVSISYFGKQTLFEEVDCINELFKENDSVVYEVVC